VIIKMIANGALAGRLGLRAFLELDLNPNASDAGF
jgi:hypothetical protein